MQLSDVLEKYTIKEISYHTKVSEYNLEKIFAKDFEAIRKPQALGFISIIEREYKADLSEFKEEAVQFYGQFAPERTKNLGISTTARHEKKEKSRGFFIIIILLLGYASWYFFTQFDKKHLSELVPFIDESTLERFISSSDENSSSELVLALPQVVEAEVIKKEVPETKIENIIPKVVDPIEKAEPVVEVVEEEEVNSTETVESNSSEEKSVSVKKVIVSIIPKNRLWFGLIDIASKNRDHFSIADTYSLDVSTTTWLVATSSASFSLKLGEDTEVFKDSKEHYFSISKEEIKSLSKSEYVALGGWEQW